MTPSAGESIYSNWKDIPSRNAGHNVGWDDQLPVDLRAKWVKFFISLFELEKLNLPRCLRPLNAVGEPWLVLLSDGNVAYGFVAYTRWLLGDSSPWC